MRSIVSVLQPTGQLILFSRRRRSKHRFRYYLYRGRVRHSCRDASVTRTLGVREGVVAVSNLANPTQVVDIEAGKRRPCRASCRHSTPDRWESPARRDRSEAGGGGSVGGGGRSSATSGTCSRRGQLLGSATWERHFGSASAASRWATSQPDQDPRMASRPERHGLSGSLDLGSGLRTGLDGKRPGGAGGHKICIPAFSNRPNLSPRCDTFRRRVRRPGLRGHTRRLSAPANRHALHQGGRTGDRLSILDRRSLQQPLAPATFAHQARLNFARLQAGVELALYPGTTLYLWRRRRGDASAAVIEGDYSGTALFTHTHHPINFSFSASHDYENHVTSSEIDLRMVAFFDRKLSRHLWRRRPDIPGRTNHPVPADVEPDRISRFYFRKWGFGVDVQGGYGTAGGFGQLSFIKQFDCVESGSFFWAGGMSRIMHRIGREESDPSFCRTI